VLPRFALLEQAFLCYRASRCLSTLL